MPISNSYTNIHKMPKLGNIIDNNSASLERIRIVCLFACLFYGRSPGINLELFFFFLSRSLEARDSILRILDTISSIIFLHQEYYLVWTKSRQYILGHEGYLVRIRHLPQDTKYYLVGTRSYYLEATKYHSITSRSFNLSLCS